MVKRFFNEAVIILTFLSLAGCADKNNNGRYQMTLVAGGGGRIIYVLDTATGKIWEKMYKEWSFCDLPKVTK